MQLNLTLDLLEESVGEENLNWFVSVGGLMRRHTQIVSIIEFIPQTVLNLMVIISTISTIYQSRVSCKPVFVFILNQAVADFALAIVFVVVVNLRHEGGGNLHNIERFVMSGCHTWTDMTC